MSARMILTNARIIGPDGEFDGTVEIADGLIAQVGEGRSHAPGAIDLEGDYLLPGLIELHTDNLEKQIKPRPAVRWPVEAAMLAHDSQVISSGITTVCDAVCVGYYGDKAERAEFMAGSIAAVREGRDAGTLKADHRLHLRCEISDPNVVALFEPMADAPELSVVSFMDHTPGQRQFRSIDKWREYQHRVQTDDLDALLAQRLENQALYADTHRQELVAAMRAHPNGHAIALASHDDTTVEHVAQAVAEGMTVSEFPTTLEAAQAARAAGLAIVMGSPNIVLGGSQSGNIGAAELAGAGLLDVLSSDYIPSSLLHGAFLLGDAGGSLAAAIAMVTANPARTLGMDDRGSIVPGLRADLVRARRRKRAVPPAILGVWRDGERAA